MNSLLTAAFVIAVIFAIFFVAVRLPLRKASIDRVGLSKWFHSLILFGKDGAYIRLDETSRRSRISFVKRTSQNEDWTLQATVSGPGVSETLLEEVKSKLTVIGNHLSLVSESTQGVDEIVFSLRGPGLKDPASLESVARLLVQLLRHPSTARYRLKFGGPKDYDAFNKYYGFKR